MTTHPRTAAPAARVTCTMAAVFTLALASLLAQAAAAATLPPPLRAKVPADFVERLEQLTGAQDVIVLFDDAAIRAAGKSSPVRLIVGAPAAGASMRTTAVST